MRIEELIIDGFKSYAVRTHITSWDPSFNAITGLNGSGKSNILDAICFVLGITNMSQVRAAQLQDLIYKRGQAGVTKASVTVVFSNENRSQSPVGFEQYRQITVTRQILLGGQSKYFINGHKAQQQAVQNLFQSVQLNINNPNFLIMQGKITKVLNMKPEEILSMIEEAAGTRMFEDRKDKALRTIAKKDKKVEEITAILKEEIEPKLEHLRKEKRSYIEFQKIVAELDHMRRFVAEYEFVTFSKRKVEITNDVVDIASKLASCKRIILQLDEELKALQQKYEEVTSKSADQRCSTLQTLEEKSRNASSEMARVDAMLEISKANLTESEELISSSRKRRHGHETMLQRKEAELRQTRDLLNKQSQLLERKVSELRDYERLLNTLSDNPGDKALTKATFEEQGRHASERLEAVKSNFDQAIKNLEYLEKEFNEKKAGLVKSKASQGDLELKYKGRCAEYEELERNLADLAIAKDVTLSVKKSLLQKQLQSLLKERDQMHSQLSRLIFNATNTFPDANKVKGPVGRLFRLKEDKSRLSLAVEISAGSRLYNIVVDDEKVGTNLLKNGGLTKRVTIIPLSKVENVRLDPSRIQKANSIAPGKVIAAVSCVDFEPAVENAIQYAFGHTFICEDSSSARAVTFDKDIRMKSVTWDGDVYDPSGTLQGGSQPTSGGLLKKVEQLDNVDKSIGNCQNELEKIESRLSAEEDARKQHDLLTDKFNLLKHELHWLENEVAEGYHAKMIKQVARLTDSIQFQKNAIESLKKELMDAELAAKTVQGTKEAFFKDKSSTLSSLKINIEKHRQEVESTQTLIKKSRECVQDIELDIEQLEKEIENTHAAETEGTNQFHKLKCEGDKLQKQSNIAEMEFQKMRSQLDELYHEVHERDVQSREIDENMKEKSSEIAEIKVQQQNLEHDLKVLNKELSACTVAISSLLKQHAYLREDNSMSEFNPGTQSLGEAKSYLGSLEEKFGSMKSRVNGKVIAMLESIEKKESSLQQMLATVHKDKQKIEQTIVSLENYKKEALVKTWETVDKDFGAIFGELLPGNYAKLVIPEGKDITQGLEVKVRLGDVWKSSLTELSGGQRSLIALSLILSLLQFKPAPMYILDEVDAALDLSHTQNIGHLLRTRFKGAQFIIVSLKDGMFNNANVLFRTRFRDGTSVVERISQLEGHGNPSAKESAACKALRV